MSRKFEIIDFRVKKFESRFSDYFAPQVKIKGRGWHYIFLGNKNNWLLLKRRWHLSASYSDDPVRYSSKGYAEEYKDTIDLFKGIIKREDYIKKYPDKFDTGFLFKQVGLLYGDVL